MASARPFRPSSQRAVEARQAGHVPQAPLVGPGFALLALLAVGFCVGPRILQLCVRLLGTLELVASGQSSRAYQLVGSTLPQLLGYLAGALASGLVVLALGRVLAQGVAFVSLSGARTQFDKLAPSRTASVLWCLGFVLLVLLTLSEWTRFTRDTLLQLATSLAIRVALLSVACLVIDIAFARARFFASLWLTRREYLDAQREAFGSPELRAARQRARAQR